MVESLFTTQTPAIGDTTDGIGYTLATRIRPAVAGTVSGVRWFFPTVTPSAGVTGGLYRRTDDSTGTLLASASFGTYTLGAWNTATFSSAVNVSANDDLYAAIYTPDRYVATGGFFTATTVTNGNLTGPADDTVTPARNGRFASGVSSLTYPNGQFNGGCYFADVVFTATSSTTTVGQTTDLRWTVRAVAGATRDLRWAVRAAIGRTRDLRWPVRTVAGATRDVRWPVWAVAGATKDARWTARTVAGRTRDVRWTVRALAGATTTVLWPVRYLTGRTRDVRWQTRTATGNTTTEQWPVRALAGATEDLRWQVMAPIGTSGRTLDLRWPVRAVTGRTADTRWQLHTSTGQAIDVRWDERALAGTGLRLRWAVESLGVRSPDANGWTARRVSARTVSALSVDWLRLTVTAPTTTDPTAALAALAVTPIGMQPAPADWQAATWEPAGHQAYTEAWPVQALTGPGTALPLPPGTYGIWLRIDTTPLGPPLPPETVITEAGTVTIT